MFRNEYYENAFKLSRFPATRYSLGENGEGMSLMTAFNAGDIVPLLAEPVFPNDKWDVTMSFLLRMFTPLHQIFSNIYLDTYVFWVNSRLNWTHWMQFCGQSDTEAFTLDFEYTIPKSTVYFDDSVSVPFYQNSAYVKSFASYLGINPIARFSSGGSNTYAQVTVVDYFRRDYLNIYNEWFRDENIIDPILYSKGDTVEDNPVFTYASPLLKSAKLHDYFTDSLPEPVRGDVPTIGDDLLVVGQGTSLHGSDPLRFGNISASGITGASIGLGLDGNYDGIARATGSSVGTSGTIVGSTNLIAKMGITIEDIRRSAVLTHVLETLTSSGTRYPEFLNGLWGASSPEVVLQIPEYVAGRRWRINISEVVSNANTVSDDGGSPIGATGAMSKTGNSGFLFRKAFSEYGHIYVLATVRIKQTYFQGIDRKFTDDSFWDLPLPQLSGLGYQARYKRELVAYPSGSAQTYDDVFGYGPAYDHYRRFPDKAMGIMRPDGAYGLKSWNASEIYEAPVSLGKDFIEQQTNGLDRCIAVPSDTRGAFQFYGEFLFTGSVTRTLPGSVPGIKRL